MKKFPTRISSISSTSSTDRSTSRRFCQEVHEKIITFPRTLIIMSVLELVSKLIKQCNSFVAKLIGLKQWTTKIQKPITPAILNLNYNEHALEKF